MPGRRDFLKRVGLAGMAPIAGSLVLTNPFVVAGNGLLVPQAAQLAGPQAAEAEPLVLLTDTVPNLVAPIEAFITESQTSIHRMSIDAMRYGDLHKAVVYGGAEVRMRLDLIVRSHALTGEQLEQLLRPRGAVRMWLEPA